jgi:hypothetical protein
MMRNRWPWISAVIAAALAVGFVAFVRLPMPFPGFAAVSAAVLAAIITLALICYAPTRWLYSDSELLTHAFKKRHDISDTRAALALDALSTAHQRALLIRSAASSFVPDLQTRALQAANALDQAARHLYYEPQRLPSLRGPIVRSELVEEAVAAHHALRSEGATDRHAQASRDKLAPALEALEQAFQEANASFESQLLLQVEAASSTAETLLAPRRTFYADNIDQKDTDT